MKELKKSGNPSKNEIEKIREIIDMASNYRIKKSVENAQIFDLEALLDNSSIALSEENMNSGQAEAKEIEELMLDLQKFQVKNDSENKSLLDEIEALKNKIIELETANANLNEEKVKVVQKLEAVPEIAPERVPERVPEAIPERVPGGVPGGIKGEGDPLNAELQKPQSGYDGLVKEDTYAQSKLKKLFSELRNKYKIDVDKNDEKEKLKYVKDFTKEQYKAYERELIELIRKSGEYEKIEVYNEKIKNLKRLYENYRGSSEYITLIRDLKNKPISYIEEELLKIIKKKLESVAESFIKKAYNTRNRNENDRMREKIIFAKKSDIKKEIDEWPKLHNDEKYVYFFPTSDNKTSFKEMFEEAILNASYA